jgi:hypothetical protein
MFVSTHPSHGQYDFGATKASIGTGITVHARDGVDNVLTGADNGDASADAVTVTILENNGTVMDANLIGNKSLFLVGGVVTFSDLGVQGDAGAHFRLRFSYRHLEVDSNEFEIKPIPVIKLAHPFPNFLATNEKISLSVELQDGVGAVLSAADILWFNLSLQVQNADAVACCSSLLNVLDTAFWTFDHIRGRPSMIRSRTDAGCLRDITLSMQYVLGDRFTLLFHFTEFSSPIIARSPEFSVGAARLEVLTQPGGSGLDIDGDAPGHNSPGIGDGTSEGCIMTRHPVVQLYGRNSLDEEYTFLNIVSPYGAVVHASLVNVTVGSNCTISNGAVSQVNLETGQVTFTQLVVSGCVQEMLALRFFSSGVSNYSAPFDVFGDPHVAIIDEIYTSGFLAFDVKWSIPSIDRLHPLLGVLFEVRACVGDCFGSVSCPEACTTSRDTCENYGLGGGGARSCSSNCNPSELQLLPVMSTASLTSTQFDQNITTSPSTDWQLCNSSFPTPQPKLCSFNDAGSHFYIENGSVGIVIPGWPRNSCSNMTLIAQTTFVPSSIILKPGVAYQFAAVTFNSHRMTRHTSAVFARPSEVDDSAPDAKFTMYSSVSENPVTLQFYMTIPAPTLWKPRLGYVVDVSLLGASFDNNPMVQTVFIWDRGCERRQSVIPDLLQTNQSADATYHSDDRSGLAFAMFVLTDGMPLVNKTGFWNGLRYINYSVPYTGQLLSLSSDYRYTVRVYTGNEIMFLKRYYMAVKQLRCFPRNNIFCSECNRSLEGCRSLSFYSYQHPTYDYLD